MPQDDLGNEKYQPWDNEGKRGPSRVRARRKAAAEKEVNKRKKSSQKEEPKERSGTSSAESMQPKKRGISSAKPSAASGDSEDERMSREFVDRYHSPPWQIGAGGEDEVA